MQQPACPASSSDLPGSSCQGVMSGQDTQQAAGQAGRASRGRCKQLTCQLCSSVKHTNTNYSCDEQHWCTCCPCKGGEGTPATPATMTKPTHLHNGQPPAIFFWQVAAWWNRFLTLPQWLLLQLASLQLLACTSSNMVRCSCCARSRLSWSLRRMRVSSIRRA